MALIRIAGCCRPRPGEELCGDAFLATVPGRGPVLRSVDLPTALGGAATASVEGADSLLLALADGLGHGPAARRAAVAVLDFLAGAAGADLVDLLRGCHRAAASSRGAAVALVLLEPRPRQVSVLAVGDLRVMAAGAWSSGSPGGGPCHFRSHNGTVGHNLPAHLVVERRPWGEGAVFALRSDGVGAELDLAELAAAGGPSAAGAAQALARHALPVDDAALLVAG